MAFRDSAQEPLLKKRSKVARALWAACGFVTFALAMVGVALPLIPTTPFLLVAAFCFVRSSKRLDAWFKSTKVYRNVLEDYVRKRTMGPKAKAGVLVPVTILLAVAALFMRNVPAGLLLLVVVWLGHVLYFGFMVKTERRQGAAIASEADSKRVSDGEIPRRCELGCTQSADQAEDAAAGV